MDSHQALRYLQSPPSSGGWHVRLHKYLRDTHTLVALTYDGIRKIHDLPELHRILNSAPLASSSTSTAADQLAAAEKQAKEAAEAIDTDFALLHAHTLMGLWGALEAAIDDLIGNWIDVMPEAMNNPVFERIKVPLGTWERMKRTEQRGLIARELGATLKAADSAGVGQFEKLLDAVGLGGAVDARLRKSLHRAQQYRNLVAHRGGIADARFVAACPHWGYKDGDEVTLSRREFDEILYAIVLYGQLVLNRCLIALGYEPNFDGFHEPWHTAIDPRPGPASE